MFSRTFLAAVAGWSGRLRLNLTVRYKASSGIDTSNAPPARLARAANTFLHQVYRGQGMHRESTDVGSFLSAKSR